ncbi:transcription factor E4F1-like [Hylaeus volcanicus]|uniref:transcription factor E4F1-like n=1 Tax=Hylaeus volcanicus TaxID=313075 RepID=UPI0023B8329A|nr:transcription factor E4F1-like [Hylaeus volcanicus]
MEEVTKCKYIDCLDAREKEHILHELPVCDTSLCVRWLINSGHVDLIGKDLNALRSMKFFVCNNHFTDDCYLSKGTLKENAVPSPHWSNVSRTLKNARAPRKIQVNGGESCMPDVRIDQPSEETCLFDFKADQWCRTCATKKRNLVSMTTKGKGTEMSLLSKLKLLIEIDDEDALPTKMCDDCVDKLEQSFKFFQQIYVADNTLRHVFPNTRSNNTPRKPLHTLGEHMRKEQTEQRNEEIEEQDRGPRIARGGIFRRGRGRPRTRGYAGRARSRLRSNQISMSITSHRRDDNDAIASSIYDSSVKEPIIRKNKVSSRNEKAVSFDKESQAGTVFSLLMDTCRSDEELDWSDVLKLMNREKYQDSKDDGKLTESEEKLERKMPETAEITIKTDTDTDTDTDTVRTEAVEAVEAVVAATAGSGSETNAKSNTEMKSIVEVDVENPPDGNKTKNEYETRCIRCQFCNETFKSKRQLEIHLVNDHSQLPRYMCTVCLACYESESQLSKHAVLRHGQPRYRCEHCQEEFLEKRVLREHVNECQPRDAIRYSYESCGVTFTSKQILVQHMKSNAETSAVVALQLDVGDSKGIDSKVSSLAGKVALQHEQEEKEKEKEKQEEKYCLGRVAASNDAITLESKSIEEFDTRTSSNRTIEMNTEQSGFEENKFDNCPDCNEKVDDTVDPNVHRIRCRGVKRKETSCLDDCKRVKVSP